MKRINKRQLAYIGKLGFVNAVQFVRNYYGVGLVDAYNFVRPMYFPR